MKPTMLSVVLPAAAMVALILTWPGTSWAQPSRCYKGCQIPAKSAVVPKYFACLGVRKGSECSVCPGRPGGQAIQLLTGKTRSTVAGDWEALDDGRLCFAGVWTAKSGRRFARTCFAHKLKDGHIYQRRLPKGEWYVFRHDPEQEGDQKLVTGDQTR